ncbi:MAG: glycosyltransferase family 2 protein [Planctomycetes bacterium]|nr:glycosyltransferase family 2 protein [Planctomycetota bacterium]
MDTRHGTLGRISAAVCNFNGREHLPPCLSALFAQTRELDEVLVVDNASSDESRALVERDFPRARWIQLATNDGPCRARNEGLAAARNEWVLLVDNDAVLEPDVLEKLERAALDHPRAVALQPRSLVASDPSLVHYDGGALHYCGLFSLRNFFQPRSSAVGAGVIEAQGVVSVALLVRRSVLLDFEGFDPTYFILFEDLDLSMRLRMAGHQLLSVEDALCLHRGGTPGISYRERIDYPERRAFLHSRNRCVHLVKNHSLASLVLGAPGIALYELVWLAFTVRSGTFGAYWRGKWAFVRDLGRLSKVRAKVQMRRRVRDRELLVGGPLTIAPQLKQGGANQRALALLDRCLAAWWTLVRWAC